MNRLRVEYDDRIDDQTIQCRVWFYPPQARQEIRVIVHVKATWDEAPEPSKASLLPEWELREGPPLSPPIKLRAVQAAQDLAGVFAAAIVPPPPG